MSVPTEIKHIVKTPGFYGGKPCIDDYKIAVHDIAVLHNQHYSPEQIIAEHYPELTQVYAALLYYYEHQAEIDAEIAAEDAEIKARAAQDSLPLAERRRAAIAERKARPGE
jgi:uncharacterized protein (DUF433 family)